MEIVYSIFCYEFVMLKNGMQYRVGYPEVLLWMSDSILDSEKSARYRIFAGYSVHPCILFKKLRHECLNLILTSSMCEINNFLWV